MGKKAYLENCKLSNLRLLESSSKYLNPDLRIKKLSLNMQYEIKFDTPTKKENNKFYLYINADLKASENGGEDYFLINAKFRGDYAITDNKDLDPTKFKDVTEPLGHQLFPVIRMFMTNLLSTMGIPLPMPWSLQGPEIPPATRRASKKKSAKAE